jgi:hypothetical protein
VVNATALDADRFAKGLQARQARVDAASDAVAQARNDALGVALPVSLGAEWGTLDADDRRGFLSAAYEAIAIARGKAPVAERVRLWTRDDPSAPRGLPGRGTGFDRLHPIADVPASAGMALAE